MQKRCTQWRGKNLSRPSFGRLVGVYIWLSYGLLFSCCTISIQKFSILGVIIIIPQECMLISILVYMVLFRAGAMAGNYGALEKRVHKNCMCWKVLLQSSALCPSLQGMSLPGVQPSGLCSSHDDDWGLRANTISKNQCVVKILKWPRPKTFCDQ